MNQTHANTFTSTLRESTLTDVTIASATDGFAIEAHGHTPTTEAMRRGRLLASGVARAAWS